MYSITILIYAQLKTQVIWLNTGIFYLVVNKSNTRGANEKKERRLLKVWREDSVVIVLPDCTVVMTVQTGQSWNVTSPVQRKGLLTACINTGIFPPVIACSLKKRSTQWIPLVFCNALFSLCLFSHLFHPDRECLLSMERADGGREI